MNKFEPGDIINWPIYFNINYYGLVINNEPRYYVCWCSSEYIYSEKIDLEQPSYLITDIFREESLSSKLVI